jgi:putative membrane protein
MMWEYSGGWPGMFMMSLNSLLWIVLIAVLVWAVVRWSSLKHVNSITPPVQPSAMEILRQRYARGEIDTATFEHMSERLQETYGRDAVAQGDFWQQD